MKHRFISILIAAASLTLSYVPTHATPSPKTHPQTLTFTTIHGDLVIDDPLVIDLIESPAMQRIKGIMQYGADVFVSPSRYPYSRFDHCLGVYQLLKKHGASRTEQVAGLLHDISHTVFSHTTEPLFMGGFTNGNYQDKIHAEFLEKYGIKEILVKYNLTVEEVLPDQAHFRALEQPSPDLCADRIEYIIHAGDMTQQLLPHDIASIHKSLHFDGQDWYFDNVFAAEKFARISLEQTENNWGSPKTILAANQICKAIKCLWDNQDITKEDIHFEMADQNLWDKLASSDHPEVKAAMGFVKDLDHNWALYPNGKGTLVVKGKFRGVDPLVKIEGALRRLTDLSPAYRNAYKECKRTMNQGWSIKLKTNDEVLYKEVAVKE